MAASASASGKASAGKHSFSSFRSQAMRPPPPALTASARRPRLTWPKAMEATMRVLTILELMRLTRTELTCLLIRITNMLPNLCEGSPERQNALIMLRNIRWVLLMRYHLAP
jgi:hypothetical protein